MKELPRPEMLPDLIQRLKHESGLDMSRIKEHTLWESFENDLAHFVVKNRQIVGCCVIWHYDSQKSGQDPAYVELGTVWAQKQDRASILAELGTTIPRLAKGKKIMGFCSQIQVARYFRKSPLFSVNQIADRHNCPQELIELFPQFRGWSTEMSGHKTYDMMLYHQDDGQIKPWYVVYES